MTAIIQAQVMRPSGDYRVKRARTQRDSHLELDQREERAGVAGVTRRQPVGDAMAMGLWGFAGRTSGRLQVMRGDGRGRPLRTLRWAKAHDDHEAGDQGVTTSVPTMPASLWPGTVQ